VKLTPIVVLGLALVAAGCSLLQQLEGGSGGAAAATTTTSSGAGGAVTATGIDCGVDPDTSATLCLGTSACPGLAVDGEVFPACGFRINGAIIDVECSCGGMLCPLGATTCAQAQALFSQDNEGIVCAQVSTGGCTQGTPAVASSAAATSGGSGTCTPACQSECGNVPSCLQLCGC
jgi:hypothetical protein